MDVVVTQKEQSAEQICLIEDKTERLKCIASLYAKVQSIEELLGDVFTRSAYVKTSDRSKVKTIKYIPPTKEGKSSGPPVKKRCLPNIRGKSIDISGVKKKKPASDIDLYCKRLREDKDDVSALAGFIQACLKDQGFKNTKITNAKALARIFSIVSDDSSNDGSSNIFTC
jgi:hypothetical protein